MRILVTNDDGVYSPGLLALARAAAKFGEVRVVAPDVEQSSTGHAITSSRPLSWRKTVLGEFAAFRVNGTPADCVALGATDWKNVDVVLSGINLGPNLGNAMWHSGTLAGAKQAALLGMRGIALSTTTVTEDANFDNLRGWIERVLDLLLTSATTLRLVNVNFPREPVGMIWARQAVRHYDGYVVPGEDPMGRKHYWFTVRPIQEPEGGTDLWAVQRGLVSVTPLQLDLTDHSALARASTEFPLRAAPGRPEYVPESEEQEERPA